MSKWFNSWTISLLIAICLYLVLSIFIFDIYKVNGSNMETSLERGKRVLCRKMSSYHYQQVVLIKFPGRENVQFSRIMALPGDTIWARHSILYLNSTRITEQPGVQFEYRLLSGERDRILEIFKENNLIVDTSLVGLSVFQFKANLSQLKKLKKHKEFLKMKRITKEFSVSNDSFAFQVPGQYWNNDNFGPVILPGKGKKIEISGKNFYLYKNIIEAETGTSLKQVDNSFFIQNKPLKEYTIKKNYYFVLNDNRTDQNDSRLFGWVDNEKIMAGMLFSLPW
ncbi:MAG: signal peptidase I [Bacteroidales bacterium]